jgi:hypothetical protein
MRVANRIKWSQPDCTAIGFEAVERRRSAFVSIVERNSAVVVEVSVRIVCVRAFTAATARETSGRSIMIWS